MWHPHLSEKYFYLFELIHDVTPTSSIFILNLTDMSARQHLQKHISKEKNNNVKEGFFYFKEFHCFHGNSMDSLWERYKNINLGKIKTNSKKISLRIKKKNNLKPQIDAKRNLCYKFQTSAWSISMTFATHRQTFFYYYRFVLQYLLQKAYT